tara:strand:- start:632 stop:997 length:366 start_codon:yes stop_codon:yes gene_type:complete
VYNETSTQLIGAKPMNDFFETQAYAQVWTSSLNRYIEDGEPMVDSDVCLYSGGLPDDYSEHYTYIPVGKIKVRIPSKEQRHQAELAALELELARREEQYQEQRERLLERRSQLLALPHLEE